MKLQTKCLTTPHCKQGTYLYASATVEAALVIPLFLYAAMSILYILQIIAIKQRVQTALYECGRELAGLAYTYEKVSRQEENNGFEKGVSVTAAYGLLIKELGNSYAKDHYIVGGNAGFCLLASDICKEGAEIDLKLSYVIQNPFDIFGLGKVSITQRSKNDAWLGEEKDAYANGKKNIKKEQSVYVTMHGEVYHIERSCTYLSRVILRRNKEELTKLINAEGGRYYPCERCGTQYGNVIYITQYGNRYHSNLLCSQLARNIITIPISEVGSRTLCKKCGGN